MLHGTQGATNLARTAWYRAVIVDVKVLLHYHTPVNMNDLRKYSHPQQQFACHGDKIRYPILQFLIWIFICKRTANQMYQEMYSLSSWGKSFRLGWVGQARHTLHFIQKCPPFWRLTLFCSVGLGSDRNVLHKCKGSNPIISIYKICSNCDGKQSVAVEDFGKYVTILYWREKWKKSGVNTCLVSILLRPGTWDTTLRAITSFSQTTLISLFLNWRCGGWGSQSSVLSRALKRIKFLELKRPEVIVGIGSKSDENVLPSPLPHTLLDMLQSFLFSVLYIFSIQTSSSPSYLSAYSLMTGDDGVLLLPPFYMIQTIDYFRSFVSDLYLIGLTAANRALSGSELNNDSV